MSHRATQWAISQRGLSPATKIVLWHLADCHNPSHGCFPSQEYLAEAAEMSRSTVNVHLSELEDRGLIQRVRSVDPATGRKQATRYILTFEADRPCPKSGHGPCPENGQTHVRNPDINLVKEPVSKASHIFSGKKAVSPFPDGFPYDHRITFAENMAELSRWRERQP